LYLNSELFFFLVVDRLPQQIQDGVRYQRSLKLGKAIRAGIAARRAADKENDEATTAAKKAKATYMVDPKKFASTASEEQLALELTEEDLGTEETHKILQCKIR
jgi:hypothetical protein